MVEEVLEAGYVSVGEQIKRERKVSGGRTIVFDK
jgi:hypothetical protein